MVFSRFASTSPSRTRLSARALLLCLSTLLVVVLHITSGASAYAQDFDGQHQKLVPTATPSATPRAKPTPKYYTNREELLHDADKFAIEKLGFEDANKNGIPDYRETYVLNKHDCTTVSAEFDYIIDQMGKAGVMDPAQAQGTVQIRGGNHAANMVPGIGVVDVTPVQVGRSFIASEGQPWYPFNRTGYTKYAEGFPDGGELTFKGYNGPRTNTAPGEVIRGSGGFGGGGGLAGGGLNLMNTLGTLLQNGMFQPQPPSTGSPPTTSGTSPDPGVPPQPTPAQQTSVSTQSSSAVATANGTSSPTATTGAPTAKNPSIKFLDSQLNDTRGNGSWDTGTSGAMDVKRPSAWDVSAFPSLEPDARRDNL